MLDAFAKLIPGATRFMHQIAPSVVATLIAAGLISGYNRAFSGHLQQPRMAALHAGEDTALPASAPQATLPHATSTVPMTKPAAAPVTEIITIHERANEEREPDKEWKAESGKDQTAIKVAVPLPAVRPVLPSKPEQRVVSLPSPAPAPVQMTVAPMAPPAPPRTAAPMAAAPMAPAPLAQAPLAAPTYAAPTYAPPPYSAPPVVVAGPAVVPAEPPPVVTGKPYVTVPDRPNQRPTYEAAIDDAPPPPHAQGPFGVIVNTLRPSSIFARMREFGDRIEATGNDILPNIRQ
jgi:hypothetical protein